MYSIYYYKIKKLREEFNLKECNLVQKYNDEIKILKVRQSFKNMIFFWFNL